MDSLTLTMGILNFKKDREEPAPAVEPGTVDGEPPKEKLITLSVAACGAGLFSDGYVNNVRLLENS